LEIHDVLAPERRLPEIKEAASGTVSGLDEFAPRDRADAAVREDADSLLEGFHGGSGLFAEDAVNAAAPELEAERLEAGLEVNDLAAPVSGLERPHSARFLWFLLFFVRFMKSSLTRKRRAVRLARRFCVGEETPLFYFSTMPRMSSASRII
jgi:hypothetical protein